MLTRSALMIAALLANVMFLQGIVPATEPDKGATVVTINGEMCGGCVKKLQGALTKLPGIARVDGNVAAKTITIVLAPQVSLSPKTIWEAVESAGKKPAKLVGPEGEFVAKPGT